MGNDAEDLLKLKGQSNTTFVTTSFNTKLTRVVFKAVNDGSETLTVHLILLMRRMHANSNSQLLTTAFNPNPEEANIKYIWG